MDKYEYTLKLEEINKLVENENYEDAAKIADTVDWRRVRNARTLCMVSEIYEANDRLEESKAILMRAYRRSQLGRVVLYRLTEVAIKMQEFDEAVEYYSEFVNAAPNDNSRYVLKYKIYRGRGSSLEDQIAILEEYKEKEYTEKWAYELAKLYSKAGEKEKCVETCDDLILWFRQGRYVVRALELKKNFAPLTPVQQAIYDHKDEQMMEKAALVDAAVPELEKVIMEKMPTSEEEAITDSIITETQKELAQAVTQHAAEAEATREPEDDSWRYSPGINATPAYDPENLQKELASNMREIVSGITRRDSDEGIIEPMNDKPFFDEEDQDAPINTQSAIVDEEVRGQNIDDVLTAMAVGQQAAGNVQSGLEAVREAQAQAAAASQMQPQQMTGEQAGMQPQMAEATQAQAGMQPQMAEATQAQTGMQPQMAEATQTQAGMQPQMAEATQAQAGMQPQMAEATQPGAGMQSQIPGAAEPQPSAMPQKQENFRPETAAIPNPQVNMGDTIDLSAALEMAAGVADMHPKAASLDPFKEEIPVEESEPPFDPKLTPDEQFIFSYFSTIQGLREHIAMALHEAKKKVQLDKTSRSGNIVITGMPGSGRTTLAIRFAKVLSKAKGEASARIAKIYAEDFNKKDIPSTIAKIAGGTLIIEEAADLEDTVVQHLAKAMEFRTDGLVIILEDEKKLLKGLFEKHPELAEKFTSEVNVPIFTNDELVAFGKTYAFDEDYKIDNMATLALYNRIGELQTPEHPVNVMDVKDIVDKAIKRSERFGLRKLGMIISRKRYDEDDRIILYEKDFK